jgi:lipoate-protein ligase A
VFCALTSTSPFENLAVEEFLLHRIEALGPTLLLYVNSDAVVMGKHQNPWLECRPDFLREKGIPLLRRFTGGGTVYHDVGNLNFSFLMPKSQYNESRHFAVVQGALADLGFESTLDVHKSLWVGERKVSGSAFARKLIGSVHHGTLLVNANLERLEAAIRPTHGDLPTRAPRSRRARVMNLAEGRRGLGVEEVAACLRQRFIKEFAMDSADLTPFWNEGDVAELVVRHKSEEWVFGATPEY